MKKDYQNISEIHYKEGTIPITLREVNQLSKIDASTASELSLMLKDSWRNY